MDSPVSDSPKILENLVAAGLVSHELIGDPSRLGTESAALGALCARIAGPVYRLGAFHYAFRVGAGDLGGALAGLEPEGWGAAIEAALTAELGEEAVWVNAASLVAEAEAGFDERAILFLRAGHDAVAAALTEAPDLRAVIAAHVAARTAETASALTAEAIEGAVRAAGGGAAELAATTAELGRRIEALEGGIGAAIAARLGDTLGAVANATAAEAATTAATTAATEAASAAASTALAAAVAAPAFAERLSRSVGQAAEGAVARAARSAVAEAVAEAVAGKMEVALAAAARQASAARPPDPALERVANTMEAVLAQLGDQAARAAEESARQDALASGIAALEASLEALTAATVAHAAEETAREAAREAELAAFENRLGLSLAEFLARLAPAAPGAGRIVEMGRSPAAAAEPVGAAEGEGEDFAAIRVAQGG